MMTGLESRSPNARGCSAGSCDSIDHAPSGSGGTGLGLAIVRDVVVAHGGTVVLDESPTHGTRAVVTLPAASPHDESTVGTAEA